MWTMASIRRWRVWVTDCPSHDHTVATLVVTCPSWAWKDTERMPSCTWHDWGIPENHYPCKPTERRTNSIDSGLARKKTNCVFFLRMATIAYIWKIGNPSWDGTRPFCCCSTEVYCLRVAFRPFASIVQHDVVERALPLDLERKFMIVVEAFPSVYMDMINISHPIYSSITYFTNSRTLYFDTNCKYLFSYYRRTYHNIISIK